MARSEIDLRNWKSIPEETLLTVAEAASVLRMSESKVRKALDNEKLPYYRPPTDDQSSGDYRIMMGDLVVYLDESKGKPKSASREETSRLAVGKPFKHIEVNWSHGPSQQQEPQDDQSSGRKARSSGRSCGRGRPR